MKIPRFETYIRESGARYAKESGFYIADGRRTFNNPEVLSAFFGDSIGIRNAASEFVYVACMDTKNHIIGCFQASAGSADASLFPVRDILQNALMIGATAIAICHNHPSGIFTPSPEDVSATKRIIDACDIVGLRFLDHIILGANSSGYCSLKCEGYI